MNANLTILIPTYNRVENLCENIQKILKNTKELKIIILDNNSDRCKKKWVEVEELIDKHKYKAKIIKNKANIGMNANVLRCIELCETKYIMILGDDDYVADDFEEIFNKYLNTDFDWLNFYSDDQFQPDRFNTSMHDNIEEFLNSFESINELVFVSVNIFKTNVIMSGLEEAYESFDLMAPHLIAMLHGSIKKTSQFVGIRANEKILMSVSNNSDSDNGWSLYKAHVGIRKIPYYRFQSSIQKILERLVNGSFKKWLTYKSLGYAIASLSGEIGVRNAMYLTKDILIYSIRNKSKYSVGMMVVYMASIIGGRKFVKLARTLKRK